MGGGGVWKLPKPRAKGSPHFSRNQIATALHQVGVLLELRGLTRLEPDLILMVVGLFQL